MHIYFTLSQIPELRELPRAVRRVIVYRALNILRSRARLFYWLPTLLCFVGGIGGSYFLWDILDYFHLMPEFVHTGPEGGLCFYLIVFPMTFAAGFIGLQLQYWKLRPLLPSAIADYISQVLKAA